MQFSAAFVALAATAVMANPVDKRNGTPYDACPVGLYSVPQCCSTDVLGVADLNCAAPSAVPYSPSNFQAICAKGGQTARCCVVPVAGQDLLCVTPEGL
ncbi:hydrophobin precursor [Xylariaceae sp. FL0594]|nr:hydrophobin precursor [Xylariaceae sp. FL0594]